MVYAQKLTQFKEYAVRHPQLAQVDMHLMRAIREPAGFAHVLVYGPSGVGKTTMIRQIARRLNEINSSDTASNDLGYRNAHVPQLPLLIMETRPPDEKVFNRTDYYRTALKLLGEPFYERRMLVDIEATQTWEKKGRGRSKTAQFNDSPPQNKKKQTRKKTTSTADKEITTSAPSGSSIDQNNFSRPKTFAIALKNRFKIRMLSN
ncbi:AAA family ATPase [Tolypothrix sp. VBCCA 56010]|uniref:AAA family ATPase n=1 Tax=Tolypothrix sp. VBCCA 56010 TaxID=3137731 RepID=UPI003D7D1C4A